MSDETIMPFDFQSGSPSIIKVIGVGGGGGNAVNHMYREGIHDVTFVVCNTDNQALDESPVPIKLQLGREGLGAGNRPERARDAADRAVRRICDELDHLLSTAEGNRTPVDDLRDNVAALLAAIEFDFSHDCPFLGCAGTSCRPLYTSGENEPRQTTRSTASISMMFARSSKLISICVPMRPPENKMVSKRMQVSSMKVRKGFFMPRGLHPPCT